MWQLVVNSGDLVAIFCQIGMIDCPYPRRGTMMICFIAVLSGGLVLEFLDLYYLEVVCSGILSFNSHLSICCCDLDTKLYLFELSLRIIKTKMTLYFKNVLVNLFIELSV